MRSTVALAALVVVPIVAGRAQPDAAELRARRDSAMRHAADGVILLHAASGLKRWEDAGFRQDPSFLYFTGLRNAQSAILVLDGPRKTSWLFVPPYRRKPAQAGFAGLGRPFVDAGSAAEAELGIDHVLAWDRFSPVIDSLIGLPLSGALVFYVDGGGQTGDMMGRESDPPAMAPVGNPYAGWRYAVAQRWPRVEIRDAFALLDSVRGIKSPGEIERLRKAQALTAVAFRAAAKAIAPGVSQRAVEAAAIAAALDAGSDGPSLWPWIRSGEMTNGAALFDAFLDYRNLDRVMKSGDVVRVDLGFDFEGYKGDFGRTLPASGRFDDAQREVLQLLNGAYLAGLATMREGSTRDQLIGAFTRYAAEHASSVKTDAGRAAIDELRNRRGLPLHGLGLDMAELAPAVFRAGMVICFEPQASVHGQQLFVEDVILITPSGHELLNPPLPYAPEELEAYMRRARR